jgi:TolB-like protein
LGESRREEALPESTGPTAPDVDVEAARAELERILASESLRSSARSREFLRFVVEECLAGRGDQLKAYSIAVDCFGREPDFDPQIDPYVRILARRLRRALARYYASEGEQDTLWIVLSKGGYVPEFIEHEPQVADPTGPAREADSLSAPTRQHPTDLATESERKPLSARRAARTPVAVARFETQGTPEYQTYLASGLTEELIVDLTGFDQLEVIGPLHWHGTKDAQLSPAELGQAYDAEFVLWGSIRGSGDDVRVLANLCEVASGTTIWAERYERSLSARSLLEVEGEISRNVAATIGDTAGAIVRRLTERSREKRPENLTSYEAVLRGYHWGMVMTAEAFDDALIALQHAVEVDAECALCRALLSDMYFSDWLSAVGTFEHGLERAEELAREAVALDPDCADAHWSLGQVHYGNRQFTRFAEEFEEALSRNSNRVLIIASQALYLVGLRQWNEAMELMGQAMRLNPHHPSWYHLVPFMNHGRQAQWLEALQDARRFRAPGLMWGPLSRASALGYLGHKEEAQRQIQYLLEAQPEFENRGRELISRLLYADENVELILAGLKKAGLEVEK